MFFYLSKNITLQLINLIMGSGNRYDFELNNKYKLKRKTTRFHWFFARRNRNNKRLVDNY